MFWECVDVIQNDNVPQTCGRTLAQPGLWTEASKGKYAAQNGCVAYTAACRSLVNCAQQERHQFARTLLPNENKCQHTRTNGYPTGKVRCKRSLLYVIERDAHDHAKANGQACTKRAILACKRRDCVHSPNTVSYTHLTLPTILLV